MWSPEKHLSSGRRPAPRIHVLTPRTSFHPDGCVHGTRCSAAIPPFPLLPSPADLDLRLTSNVGALGTAGLLLRSFQRSFAGVCVLRLHEGLLQAVEVWIWVYSVVVHGCSATPDHHHPLTSAVAGDNFAFFAVRHAAPLTATYPDTAQRENRDKLKWLKTVSAGSKCQTTPGSGSSLPTATVPSPTEPSRRGWWNERRSFSVAPTA